MILESPSSGITCDYKLQCAAFGIDASKSYQFDTKITLIGGKLRIYPMPPFGESGKNTEMITETEGKTILKPEGMDCPVKIEVSKEGIAIADKKFIKFGPGLEITDIQPPLIRLSNERTAALSD